MRSPSRNVKFCQAVFRCGPAANSECESPVTWRTSSSTVVTGRHDSGAARRPSGDRGQLGHGSFPSFRSLTTKFQFHRNGCQICRNNGVADCILMNAKMLAGTLFFTCEKGGDIFMGDRVRHAKPLLTFEMIF